MRILFALLPILLFTSCASPLKQNVTYTGIAAGISAPQTLQLMDDVYEARYSASGSTHALVEYYRPGENPKSWKRMLALRLNLTSSGSLQEAQSLEHLIRTRGSRAVRVYKDRDTDGYGIEFIVTARGYQELNVFRYVDRPGGPGTISFQYAEIIPSEQLRSLDSSQVVEHLRSLRLRAVKAMESATMPLIEKTP